MVALLNLLLILKLNGFQAQTIDLLPIGGIYFKYNQFSESNQMAFQNMTLNLPAERSNNIPEALYNNSSK
ncbi:hypothetical protein [Epilithonimonas hispanica]|uniref:Uncharacterized protein n=1 Tax=Epilithonimonas hispanica TaxID=358687 RepID=A0A3D9CWX9_9FLAO|nr:hypothetical protein [Epilithonimonas hispanica]REC70285.1 hypothetical protein DRF58_09895 [Epilithonimonas hispanica]